MLTLVEVCNTQGPYKSSTQVDLYGYLDKLPDCLFNPPYNGIRPNHSSLLVQNFMYVPIFHLLMKQFARWLHHTITLAIIPSLVDSVLCVVILAWALLLIVSPDLIADRI